MSPHGIFKFNFAELRVKPKSEPFDPYLSEINLKNGPKIH